MLQSDSAFVDNYARMSYPSIPGTIPSSPQPQSNRTIAQALTSTPPEKNCCCAGAAAANVHNSTHMHLAPLSPPNTAKHSANQHIARPANSCHSRSSMSSSRRRALLQEVPPLRERIRQPREEEQQADANDSSKLNALDKQQVLLAKVGNWRRDMCASTPSTYTYKNPPLHSRHKHKHKHAGLELPGRLLRRGPIPVH